MVVSTKLGTHSHGTIIVYIPKPILKHGINKCVMTKTRPLPAIVSSKLIGLKQLKCTLNMNRIYFHNKTGHFVNSLAAGESTFLTNKFRKCNEDK
jgi:hypothetical protein